jgi:IS605 OrfB family transposase
MKLTLQLKLLPTEEQAAALLHTMERCNAAATFAAEQGFAAGVFSAPSIQKLCYTTLRERFDLSAQMAIRAIGKAAEAFSRDKTVQPVFRPDGAIVYDERILSFKGCHKVSILTIGAGRLLIPYVFGEYQAANLARIRGQCDLVYRGTKWFLFCTIEFREAPPVEVKGFLGVDLGIVNLATDSAGNVYTGEQVQRNRRRRATARKQYQRKGTKAAKRKLRKMAGRQARFQRHENHRIANRLVAEAKAQSAGISLEDLNGIRGRLRGTVGFRRQLGNWGFHQLRTFVEYKARRAGVPVVFVDPRNTSRICSACGHCEKANRPNQATFRCKHCGHQALADLNAATNLARLGEVAWGARNPPSKLPASPRGKATPL